MYRLITPLVAAAVLSGFLVLPTGCTPDSDVVMVLAYTDTNSVRNTSGDPLNDGDALAVGTHVELRAGTVVRDDVWTDTFVGEARLDDGPEVTITEVSSEDPQKLEVVRGDADDRFELLAHETTEDRAVGLEVAADVEFEDGHSETFEWSNTVTIHEIDDVEVGSLCNDDVYLTDSTARFQYQMYNDEGDLLFGHGRYPLDVVPSDGGTVLDGHSLMYRADVDTDADSGEYKLVSRLDEDESVAFELIGREEVDDIDIYEDRDGSTYTWESNPEVPVLHFRIYADETTVCGPASEIVELSATPSDKCTVEMIRDYRDVHSVELTAHAPVTCQVTITEPGIDYEESISVEFID